MPVLIDAPISTRVRADALPEYTRYRDGGCDVHPQCLTCPLPRCRYDERGGLRALLNTYRDRQVVELKLKGTPVADLARRFGVSRRTVFRILESRALPSGRQAPRRPLSALRLSGGGRAPSPARALAVVIPLDFRRKEAGHA